MKPKGRCFAKKCEDCNWWQPWDITEVNTGLRKVEHKCSIQVMCETLPKLIGAVDGLQGGVNEARNRSMEVKDLVENFGNTTIQIIQGMGLKILEQRSDNVQQLQSVKTVGEG